MTDKSLYYVVPKSKYIPKLKGCHGDIHEIITHYNITGFYAITLDNKLLYLDPITNQTYITYNSNTLSNNIDFTLQRFRFIINCNLLSDVLLSDITEYIKKTWF
jgi:hypothetical protein